MPTNSNTVSDAGEAAFAGESQQFVGVQGISMGAGYAGVLGVNDEGDGNGVSGHSAKNDGVLGVTTGEGKAGIAGVSATTNGNGVYGRSDIGNGIFGIGGSDGSGVVGVNDVGTGNGVFARAVQNDAILGISQAPGKAGVAGVSEHATGSGVYGRSASGHAGFFDGSVTVTRDLTVNGDIVLAGADLAEEFEVVGPLKAQPGCVVVLAGDQQIRVSDQPYDRRVAGVVSGAGSFRPAVIMDRQEGPNRRPLAMTGKVWCQVDVSGGEVHVGDLLTTSPAAGHAMRATDPESAFGAVIGKALAGLTSGQGLIPILVSLQ